MKKKFCYLPTRPAVTVDVVIVTVNHARVLLICRWHEPYTALGHSRRLRGHG